MKRLLIILLLAAAAAVVWRWFTADDNHGRNSYEIGGDSGLRLVLATPEERAAAMRDPEFDPDREPEF